MSKSTYEGINTPIIDDFCNPEPQEEMFPRFPDFLFTELEFNSARVRDLLECRCSHCGKTFQRSKRDILKKHYKTNRPLIYCSQKCVNEHKILLTKERKHHNYTCKICGKHVSKNDWYGSGMFCSEHCSRKYSSGYANSLEARQKKSKTLKERIWKTDNISCYENCSHKSHKQETINKSTSLKLPRRKYNENELLIAISFLHKKWNLQDINKILNLNDKTYKNFIGSHSISEEERYVNFKRYKVIERCRIALNKPFEDGSITIDDLKLVQDKCHQLMFENDWSADEVCRNYLQMKSPNPKFLELSLGIQLRSLSMASTAHYRKLGYYDNRDAEEAYRAKCEFRFSSKLYPYILGYELLKHNKWYHSIKNPDGISKDHMISIYYGFTHNIDPYLISHPANCMFMFQAENASKKENCSISLQELIERVEWFNETILYKDSNLDLARKTKIRYKPCNKKFSTIEMKHFLSLSLL